MHKPFFSVITATFNRSATIARALDSLLEQLDSNWECLIIDDGSNDNTSHIVNNYLKNKKFKYYYHRNKGAGFSKNRGIMLAKGEYVTFLDSDDEYIENHLSSRKEILLNKIKDTNYTNPSNSYKEIDLLYGGCQIIGNPYVPDVDNLGKLIHLNNCFIGGTMFVNRKKAIDIGGFTPLRFGDDTDFYRRAIQAGFNITKTDIPTYIYHRDSQDSLCGL